MRDLFKQAKEAAPAIVFIDQPDAYRVADVEPSRLDAEARAKAQASP